MIPTYGITGAAVASLLGHIACSVAFIIYFSKETQIPIKDIVLIKKDDFRLIMKK